MGTLTPGATYIYERADGVIYAREFGNHASKRIIVGYDSPADYDRHAGKADAQLWMEIRKKAKDNATLQDALDRVVEIYNLIKDE